MRARYLLPWLVVGAIFGFAPGELVRSKEWLRAHPDDPLPTVLGGLLISATIFAGPSLYAWWVGLRFKDLYGAFPSRRAFVQLALAGIPSLTLTVALFYAVFVPLSLLFPEGVQSWLFDESAPIYSVSAPYPYVANMLGFILVVVAAPIAEEWFIRGLLLGRWSRKVGTVRAIARTSIMFGLLHQDVVGALVGAVILCGVYAHYRSLWAPTIVHASHNLIVWVFAVLMGHGFGPVELTTVEQLRHAWWLPIGGLLITLPWAIHLRTRVQPFSTWRFPDPRGRVETALDDRNRPAAVTT